TVPSGAITPNPMSTRRLPLFPLVFAVLGLAAIGGGDEPGATPEPTPTPPQTPHPTQTHAPNTPAPATDRPTYQITMNPVGEQMEYKQKEFTVHPGQTGRITFQNTATTPAMHHNVVVLQAGANVNAIGQAAMGAAANDYIPQAQMDQIIAHTPMSAPGETVEVEFTAP